MDGQPVVEVTGPDGTVALPALWLRERSQAPDQLDLVTGQRLFDPHRLPPLAYEGLLVAGSAAAALVLFRFFEVPVTRALQRALGKREGTRPDLASALPLSGP